LQLISLIGFHCKILILNTKIHTAI